MREELIRAYREAADRDDRLIPDTGCEHGSNLRHCGYLACIERRYNILRSDRAVLESVEVGDTQKEDG